MHCREAKNRIEQRLAIGGDMTGGRQLEAHLAKCPKCASLAESSGLLDRLLAASAVDDTDSITPLELQRLLVKQRLQSGQPRAKNLRLRYTPRSRRSLAALGAVVTVGLLLFSIIPFGYDHTIGYDLTMAGVERDLVGDDEKLCQILHQLGLFEAGVDVEGCDTTCRLSVLDLKTEREARLVVGAISSVNDFDLTTSIVPIRARTSGSLLEQANRIFRRGES